MKFFQVDVPHVPPGGGGGSVVGSDIHGVLRPAGEGYEGGGGGHFHRFQHEAGAPAAASFHVR